MQQQPRWLQQRSWVFGIVGRAVGSTDFGVSLDVLLVCLPRPYLLDPTLTCVNSEGGLPTPTSNSQTPAGSRIQLSSDTIYPEMGTGPFQGSGPLDVSPPYTPRTSDASHKSRFSPVLLTDKLGLEIPMNPSFLGFN